MSDKGWMERALCAEEALLELWDQYQMQKKQHKSWRWLDAEDDAAIKNAEKQVEWIRRDWDAN